MGKDGKRRRKKKEKNGFVWGKERERERVVFGMEMGKMMR